MESRAFQTTDVFLFTVVVERLCFHRRLSFCSQGRCVCQHALGQTPPGQTPSPDGHCSGRYASYWNASLCLYFVSWCRSISVFFLFIRILFLCLSVQLSMYLSVCFLSPESLASTIIFLNCHAVISLFRVVLANLLLISLFHVTLILTLSLSSFLITIIIIINYDINY